MHCEYPIKNFEFIINSLGNVSCMGDPHTGDPRDRDEIEVIPALFFYYADRVQVRGNYWSLTPLSLYHWSSMLRCAIFISRDE